MCARRAVMDWVLHRDVQACIPTSRPVFQEQVLISPTVSSVITPVVAEVLTKGINSTHGMLTTNI